MRKRIACGALCILLALSLFAGCKGRATGAVAVSTAGAPLFTIPEAEEEPLCYNYLTGLCDLAPERAGQRPFAVSVNNNYASWPQYGVSRADIVVEIETEGGITRLMALYSDPSDVGYIGSVRSLRHQFIQAVGQWDPIITHIGTSTVAEEWVWGCGLTTLNGYYTEDFLYIDRVRMETYASEHCKFTENDLLYAGCETLGIDTALSREMPPAFNFTTDPENKIIPATGDARRVTFEFSGLYDGELRYHPLAQKYYKWQDGEPQIDAGNNDAQMCFDNCLLLLAYIGGIADTELVDVDYSGGGEGFYFSQGRYEHITWQKPAWDADFIFRRDDGSELVLNTGTTYLAVIRDYFDDTVVIEG